MNNKKVLKLTLLGVMVMVFLSGCFSYRFGFEHNADGSGKIKVETILNKEFLDMADDLGAMTDEDEDSELDVPIFTKDELQDDPNIKSVKEDEFIDPDTGAKHHLLEIEVYDILKSLRFDEDDEDAEGMVYKIEDQGNGTYRFSAFIDSPGGLSDDEEDGLDADTFKYFLVDSKFIWELKVAEFLEGDSKASFDKATNTVTWEIPMTDILFGTEPTEIYAVYNVKSSGFAKPEPKEEEKPVEEQPVNQAPQVEAPLTPLDESEPDLETEADKGFLGLSKWVSFALVGLLCTGVIFVIIIVVVILVVKKKKKNQPQE